MRINPVFAAPLLAGAGLALATPAHAVSFVIGSFLEPTATAYTGFESIGPHGHGFPLFYGPYVQHGIQVEHFGLAGVASNFQHEGKYSFYGGTDSPGYTSIKLADGNPMNAIQFDATTEMLTDLVDWPFHYQLLYQGDVVASGTEWRLCSAFTQCFRTFGFEGGRFDEMRIQGSILIDSFDPNGFGTDTVVLDNIYVREVPEPATWALMVGGFALLGAAVRRKRMAVSFA